MKRKRIPAIQVDEWGCALSVKNTGHGFDARELRGVMPNPSSPPGRGVSIMQAVMDQVDFSSEPEADTIVHLVKALTPEPDSLLRRLPRKEEVRP